MGEASVVVGAAIIRGGRVLAARRTTPPSAAGRWELPGGKVEPGETPSAALVREVGEELGCVVSVDSWLDGSVPIRPGLELRVAVASLVSGQPVPVEHDAVRWLSSADLDSVDWLEPDLPFVAALVAILGDAGARVRPRPDQRPDPPASLLAAWGLRVQAYAGGRDNRHWLVDSGGRRAVLRSSWAGPGLDVGYELAVLEHLAAGGWPVPRPLEQPTSAAGETWCLFTHLPGEPLEGHGDPAAQRERGRLLAWLHLATAELTTLGQRGGWRRVTEVVADERFDAGLARYAACRPREAGILRWHLDRCRELFASYDAATAPTTVLHGDLTAWNLLHVGADLTGILDFEMSHLDLRVADFALSWRGAYDGVVAGYAEVTRLDDRERALITPAWWAWTLIGVVDELDTLDPRTGPVPTFDWTIAHLLRRSPLMGADAAPYQG